MMLALGKDGNVWVAQSSTTGQSADVLIYHPDNGAIARIALPEDAYPTDLVSVGDSIIVSDMDLFPMYRIDISSHNVSDFGDSDISRILRAAEASRAGYESRMIQAVFAMIVFGILMIGSAVWATPKGQRLTRHETAAPLEATTAPIPEVNGIYWLKRNIKTDRFLAWIQVGMSIAIALLIVALLNLFITLNAVIGEAPSAEDLARIEDFKHVMLLIMIVFAGTPILTHLGLRNMKLTLGTDGNRLYIKHTDGRQMSFAPEQLVYGGRKILFQDRCFAIQTGKRQPLYASGEVETYIAPLLLRAKKLSTIDLLRYQLTHREITLTATLVYALIIAGVTFTTGLWRQFLP